MGQPVKVSDELLLDARLAADALERSIAGQIEFWARLGRVVESVLEGSTVQALCRSGAVQPLSAALKSVDTPKGRQRVFKYLQQRPYPHYESAPKRPGLLIRIDAKGKRTLGRFVNRQFQPAKLKRK